LVSMTLSDASLAAAFLSKQPLVRAISEKNEIEQKTSSGG
jgi:hypothetical protein